MPSKGSISVVEQHVEKGILGLAALALVGVAVYFFGLNPNRIEYMGKQLGPAELDDAISEQASGLETAVKNAKPKPAVVPEFATALRTEFESGIFKSDPNRNGPAVRPELATATRFGQPIPALEAATDVETNIAVVKVLPPSRPVSRTGISLAVRHEIELEKSTTTPPAPTPADAEGFSWVTVASYFPLEALKREMTAAGYAAPRARVDVLSVDVQRQELLPSGEFSEWRDVTRGKAAPAVEAPAPILDTLTGNIVNQTALDNALILARSARHMLMQPRFYEVLGGDDWELPPLPGIESVELAVATGKPPPPPAGGGPAVPPGDPGAAGAAGVPPGDKPVAGGGAAKPPSGARPGGKNPEQERIKKALADARVALRESKWDEAIRIGESIQKDASATRQQQTLAKKIIAKAQREKEKGTRIGIDPNVPVTNPTSADKDPAIWFHDDTVEPGKTYRYRMRISIWNGFVGRRAALRDPSQAEKSALVGEWSEPGDPVEVAPRVRFYVRAKGSGNDPAALVDVFAWHSGNWYKESFNVQPGDTIGEPKDVKLGESEDGKPQREMIDFGTGAVVLDIRVEDPVWMRRAQGKGEFAYSEQRGVTIVYVDPVDGQVKQRFDRLDRLDRKYTELREETEEL